MAERHVDTPNGSVVVKIDVKSYTHGADALKAARVQAERQVAPRRLTGAYGVRQDGDTLVLTFPLVAE